MEAALFAGEAREGSEGKWENLKEGDEVDFGKNPWLDLQRKRKESRSGSFKFVDGKARSLKRITLAGTRSSARTGREKRRDRGKRRGEKRG